MRAWKRRFVVRTNIIRMYYVYRVHNDEAAGAVGLLRFDDVISFFSFFLCPPSFGSFPHSLASQNERALAYSDWREEERRSREEGVG